MASAYFKNLTSQGVPFMDGRDRGDINDLVNEDLHVEDYGYIRGKKGEYAVIAFREYPKNFYFGGMVLTDILHRIDRDNMKEQLLGETMRLSMKDAKEPDRDGNIYQYMVVDFI